MREASVKNRNSTVPPVHTVAPEDAALGHALRLARMEKMRMEDFARELGVSVSTVRWMETGQRLPIPTMRRAAEALGLELVVELRRKPE
jgi:transcriptional regulator with XRE-family HTH domain